MYEYKHTVKKKKAKMLMYSGRMGILEDDNKFLHQTMNTVAKSSSCMGNVPLSSTLIIKIVSCSALLFYIRNAI